nr:MAG TPA: hypothetical protein [Caudoviricetes sp.]
MRGWRMNWYWLQLNKNNRGAVKSTPLFFLHFFEIGACPILEYVI